MKKNKTITCHVVSHTHWDRAWYLPFEKFRIRLVSMMDHLLKQLSRKEFRYFVFDGQMAPLEDYLEIRPERKKDLARLARRGKLVIGPAYILPDEFLISAEAHVRNLVIGHQMARELGPVQKVGSYPDTFGHVSQMPQILNGFGIDSFFFMRGLGDEGENLGLEFWWESPGKNGRVIACHQIASYGNARMLGIPHSEQELYPVDYPKAQEDVERQADFLLNYAGAAVLLLNNGIDHLFAQEKIPEIIEYINKHSQRLELIHSTFSDFIQDVRIKHKRKFKVYRGEMHYGRYNFILTGTLSSRMYLKQANFKCQIALERMCEPLASLAWMLGADYPEAFLLYAWKTLLKNHPHDDICGCSVDAVHRDMMNRFEHVEQVAEVLVKNAFDQIMSCVRFKGEEYGIPLLVLNTRPVERGGEVRAEVVVPCQRFDGKKIGLMDFQGRPVPACIVPGQKYKQPQFWGDREVQKLCVSFLSEALPPLGYRAYYLRDAKEEPIETCSGIVSVTPNSLENDILKVFINANGSLNVLHKETGFTIEGIHFFEDCADTGDEYDFSPLKADEPLLSKNLNSEIRTEAFGGYKAVAHVSLLWPLPASLNKERTLRSEERILMPVHCEITLRRGERRIEFRTEIDNMIQDHRLRVVFPTPLITDKISVESKFDVIDRPLVFPPAPHWSQQPLNTRAQDHFASFSNGAHGASFLNKGLPEYEAEIGENGVSYHLTLLRAVGWLSRADLLTRRDNAGPSLQTPEAQCPGRLMFEYALVIHRGNWEEAHIAREAYDYTTPILSYSFYHQVRDWKGESRFPEEAGLIQLKPEALVLTCLKKAEKRGSLVLRLYNPGTIKLKGTLDFAFDIKEAFRIRLDETRLAPLPIAHKHIVSFLIRPREIVTLETVL